MLKSWIHPNSCAFTPASAPPFPYIAPLWARSCWPTCPKTERKQALPQLGLKRLTPNTVGNLQELEAELYRVRKNGYACDLEEHELHIRCVAAPIWDHAGGVNASLSITAPMVRMPVTRLRQLATAHSDRRIANLARTGISELLAMARRLRKAMRRAVASLSIERTA